MFLEKIESIYKCEYSSKRVFIHNFATIVSSKIKHVKFLYLDLKFRKRMHVNAAFYWIFVKSVICQIVTLQDLFFEI